jgi:DNA-binding NarL/FixJ family response regulator
MTSQQSTILSLHKHPSSTTPNSTAIQPLPVAPSAFHLAPIPITMITSNRILAEGLLLVLQQYLQIDLVGSYQHNVQDSAASCNPEGHIVLLDTGIGQASALIWLHYWRSIPAPPDVLVLDVPDDIERILQYIEAGAFGYTLEGASGSDVAAAIRHAAQGITHCSPAVTAQLFRRLEQLRLHTVQPVATTTVLTARELDILRCIAGGMGNKEIASVLVISLATVKHHVHNILYKLNVTHRWEALQLAKDNGWMLSHK